MHSFTDKETGIDTRRRMLKPLVAGSILFFMLFLIAPAVAAADLTAAEKTYLSSKSPTVFISQSHYPPFEFRGPDGDHTGMCIDLVRWIATEFGFKVYFTDASFKEAQDAVLSEKAEVITSLFYSEKRDRVFDFTDEIFAVPASIFVVSERPDITGITDLNGKTIAMQQGDYAEEFLGTKGIACTITYTRNFAEATDLVIAGQADAVIGDEQIVLYHLFSNDLTERIKKVGEPLYVGKNCMGTKDPNPVLVGILNKGIRLAQEKGVLDRINTKWIGTRYATHVTWFQRHATLIAVTAGGLLLAGLLGWLWNVQLHREVTARTQALSASEHRYRTLINSMQEGLVEVDAQWRITFVNDRFVTMCGRGRDTLVGRYFHDIVSEKSRPKAVDELDRRRQRRTGPYELELASPDGGTIDILCSPNPAYDAAGNYLGGFGVISDITEIKRSQKKLRKSEERYRFLAENMGDIVWTLDMDLNTTYVSPSIERVLGYTPEERMRQALENQVTQASYERVVATLLAELARDKTPGVDPDRVIVMEVEYFHRNGSIVWIENLVKARRNDAGDMIGMYGVSRDVTRRKMAEEEIRRANREWERTFDAVPDLIALLDSDYRITKVNRAMAEKLAIAPHEAVGRTCYECVHGTDAPPMNCPHKLLLADGREHVSEVFEDKIGGDFLVSVSPLIDGQDRFVGSVHIARDISDQKQAEKAIRESEARFRAIFDQASVGVSLTETATGVILHANRRYLQILGRTAEEVIGRTYMELTHPDDLEYDLAHMKRLKNGEIDEFTIEKRYLHSDGTTVWGKLSVSPMWTAEAGARPHHIAIIEDISDRKRSEKMLQIQRDLAVALSAADSLPTAMNRLIEATMHLDAVDCAGVYLLEKDTGALNLVAHQGVSDRFAELVAHLPPASKQADVVKVGNPMYRHYSDVAEGDAVQMAEQIRAFSTLPIFHDGLAVGSLNLGSRTCDHWPQTTRHAMETLAAQTGGAFARIIAEERLLAAIDAIDEGFVIYDPEDRLAMCNAKYIEIYGKSKDLLVPGARFEDIIREGANRGQYPAADGHTEAWIAERMAHHRHAENSCEQRLSDGRWLKIAERRMKDGSTVGFRVDITDIKDSEARLQRAVREKEALLREIHHRVKNSLQVVSSLLSLEADKHDDHPQVHKAFGEAEARVRAMSLVHEVLYQSEDLSEVALQQYLESLTAHLLEVFRCNPGVVVAIDIDAGEVALPIEQAVPCGLIVNELVTNAMKYAFSDGDAGRVSITARVTRGDLLEMVIADNGCGMPPAFDSNQQKTLGIHLVRDLIEYQLEGTWECQTQQGTRWVIQWRIDN